MTKKFNIHEWQANQIKQRLTEHTVNFTKDDMATLHNDGKLVKADDDGKDHTYIFKGDLKEQGFDAGLKAAGGFSDEEFDDITSRDIGDPFPLAADDYTGDTEMSRKASDLIKKLREDYRNMSDKELDIFSSEMIEHFLNNTAAQARAKVFFARTEL